MIRKVRQIVLNFISEHDYTGYEIEVSGYDYSYQSYSPQETEREPYDACIPVDDIDDDLRKMGWTREGSYWYGWYTDKHGNKYRGRLSRLIGNHFIAEIREVDIPDYVRYGKHGGCFLKPYKGWQEIHFDEKYDHPKSLVAGVHQCINHSYPANGSAPAFYQRTRSDVRW